MTKFKAFFIVFFFFLCSGSSAETRKESIQEMIDNYGKSKIINLILSMSPENKMYVHVKNNVFLNHGRPSHGYVSIYSIHKDLLRLNLNVEDAVLKIEQATKENEKQKHLFQKKKVVVNKTEKKEKNLSVKERMKLRLPEIIKLKQSGKISENANGFLDSILNTKDVESIVYKENQDRLIVYKKIADKTNSSVKSVGIERARQIRLKERSEKIAKFEKKKENAPWYIKEKYNRDDKIDAQIFVENRVKAVLKAPSTARFPSVRKWEMKKLHGQTYRIGSYVDAQNSFGAMIRTRFVGIAEQVSKGRWKLISLSPWF